MLDSIVNFADLADVKNSKFLENLTSSVLNIHNNLPDTHTGTFDLNYFRCGNSTTTYVDQILTQFWPPKYPASGQFWTFLYYTLCSRDQASVIWKELGLKVPLCTAHKKVDDIIRLE